MRSKMCSNVFDESMQHSLGIDLKNSDDRKPWVFNMSASKNEKDMLKTHGFKDILTC